MYDILPISCYHSQASLTDTSDSMGVIRDSSVISAQKCRQVILPEAFNSKYSSANPCSRHPLPENTSSTDWTQCREQPQPYCSCDQNKDSKRYISRFQFAVHQNLGTCYVLRNRASILGLPRWHGSERISK